MASTDFFSQPYEGQGMHNGNFYWEMGSQIHAHILELIHTYYVFHQIYPFILQNTYKKSLELRSIGKIR